jgi:ABC-2 type transport system permease protein
MRDLAEVVGALWRRDLVKFTRDRQQLLGSATRPLLWLLAFGLGLRGSFRGDTSVDYVTFIVPGLATMTVLFAGMFQSISLVWDREFGFLKELLVAPVPRVAFVIAKMLAGATLAVLEASVVLLMSLALGVRWSILGALPALAILAVFGMAVSGFGVFLASRMKSFEGFGVVVNFVIQPVFFLSGALYPLEGLPAGLRFVVALNPMSYAVDAARGLLVGVHHLAIALDAGVVVACAVAFGALGTWSFGRMQA